MNWADRVSWDFRFWVRQGLLVCLLLTIALSGYVVVTDAWQVSQNYCVPNHREPTFVDVPWRGPGGFCTPQVGPSIILLLIMSAVLYLPVVACFFALAGIVLRVCSSNRV